jgi:N-acetylglucosamine-6-sulfatase
MAELYDVKNDPDEMRNLIFDPTKKQLIAQLKEELPKLMKETGLTPENDKMPIDQGIGKELPDAKIR